MTAPHQPFAGQFALAGPGPRLDPRTVPVRGDLAHIDLAGQHFVPHYAVPQPRRVLAATAIRTAPGDDAEVVDQLSAGERFDVLDISGAWGWGLRPGGAVGYVALSDLGEAEGEA